MSLSKVACRRTGALAVMITVLACGGGGEDGTTTPPPPPPPPAPVSTVDLNPTSGSVAQHDTVSLTATPRDANGIALPRTVTWSSSDATKATVSSAGFVAGISPGVTTITATSEGKSASASITVTDDGMIGRNGGSITALNGMVKLTVPNGALTQNALITVRPAAGIPANPRLVPQTAVELGPNGLTFAVPVRLELAYQGANVPAGPPERLLGIHRATSGAWQEVAGATVDQVLKSVSVNLASFSSYAILTAPFVDNLLVSPPNAQLAPGEAQQFSATPRDATNVTLAGRDPAMWASSNTAVATINASGLLTAVAPGSATITATLEGRNATASVTVGSPGSPTIAGVAPSTLLPGGSGTITGANFGSVTANLAVTVAGVVASITSSTPTTINFTLPASGFPCQATQPVPVAVTRAGTAPASRNHPLATATQRNLAVGETLYLLTPAAASCNELSLTGGEYLMSIVNSTGAPSASTALEFVGAGGTGAMQYVAPPVIAARATASAELAELRGFAEAHFRHLENDRVIARTTAARTQARLRSGRDRVSAAVSTTVGTVNTVNVQNLSATSCASVTPIQARTVFVGPRVIIVEDVAAPLAGTMDAAYAAIGNLYESSMHSILTTYAGNPLARDAVLDNDGRIVMVFTPLVNSTSAFAYVSSCDVLGVAGNAGGEYFYSRVPETNTGTTNATSDFLGWSKYVPGVVIHEVKHIVSFAERISRAGTGPVNYEESFLEEGTAMILQELWVRQRLGLGARANIDYMTGLYCDWRFRGTVPAQCANWYISMYANFDWLGDYLTAQPSRSLFGSTGSGDVSFYGSMWAFLRWMADHYATSESAFFREMIQSTTSSGVANIEARTGRPIAELIGKWAIAMFADDRSAFAVNDTRLSFPSWQIPNVYIGLNTDFPTLFTTQSPFVGYLPNFGNFTVQPTLRGGTAALVWIRGTQNGSQLLRLTGQGGASLPAGIALAIVRNK